MVPTTLGTVPFFMSLIPLIVSAADANSKIYFQVTKAEDYTINLTFSKVFFHSFYDCLKSDDTQSYHGYFETSKRPNLLIIRYTCDQSGTRPNSPKLFTCTENEGESYIECSRRILHDTSCQTNGYSLFRPNYKDEEICVGISWNPGLNVAALPNPALTSCNDVCHSRSTQTSPTPSPVTSAAESASPKNKTASTTSLRPTSTSNSGNGTQLRNEDDSSGVIAGAVVAVLLIVLAIIVLTLILWRRRRLCRKNRTSENGNTVTSTLNETGRITRLANMYAFFNSRFRTTSVQVCSDLTSEQGKSNNKTKDSSAKTVANTTRDHRSQFKGADQVVKSSRMTSGTQISKSTPGISADNVVTCDSNYCEIGDDFSPNEYSNTNEIETLNDQEHLAQNNYEVVRCVNSFNAITSEEARDQDKEEAKRKDLCTNYDTGGQMKGLCLHEKQLRQEKGIYSKLGEAVKEMRNAYNVLLQDEEDPGVKTRLSNLSHPPLAQEKQPGYSMARFSPVSGEGAYFEISEEVQDLKDPYKVLIQDDRELTLLKNPLYLEPTGNDTSNVYAVAGKVDCLNIDENDQKTRNIYSHLGEKAEELKNPYNVLLKDEEDNLREKSC